MRIGEYGKKPNIRVGLALIAEALREVAKDTDFDVDKKMRALAVVARDRATRNA